MTGNFPECWLTAERGKVDVGGKADAVAHRDHYVGRGKSRRTADMSLDMIRA